MWRQRLQLAELFPKAPEGALGFSILENDEAPGTKSSRQSKSKTAAGKKTNSAAMK